MLAPAGAIIFLLLAVGFAVMKLLMTFAPDYLPEGAENTPLWFVSFIVIVCLGIAAMCWSIIRDPKQKKNCRR